MERRDFIKLTSLAGTASLLSSFLPFSVNARTGFASNRNHLHRMNAPMNAPMWEISPDELTSIQFNGDNPDKAHHGLWNPDGVAKEHGGWPQPSEFQKLVIIGGGLSGLLSAYYLQDLNPLILEMDKNFGGNSKGEILSSHDKANVPYSIGAAYITVPEKDSAIYQLLQDLKLVDASKIEGADDSSYFYKQQILKDFWSGATDPKNAAAFVKVHRRLQELYQNSYPDIPWSPDSQITYDEYLRWDALSFSKWLSLEFGELHPHIIEYFELYSWSSFTATINEVSALQMLNFVLAELDGVMAFPGGNSAITNALFQFLSKKLGPKNLRAECVVIKIQSNTNGVIVYYLNANNELRAIQTEQVVFAGQKFVAKNVCVEMPKEQVRAIEDMTYRGYIVANAFYNKAVSAPGFDLYCYDGQVPVEPTPLSPPPKPFTDIIFANWASQKPAQNDLSVLTSKYSVLTIYKPMPFDGARQFLFSPFAHEKHMKIIKDGLRFFEKSMGFSEADLQGLRLTRWGHSLPVASVGFFSSGQAEIVNRPIQNKIFFANQDNWANPAFESAFAAVEDMKRKYFSSL